MQTLRSGSKPSGQGTLRSRNSEWGLGGEGVVPLPFRLLTHWGMKASEITDSACPGLSDSTYTSGLFMGRRPNKTLSYFGSLGFPFGMAGRFSLGTDMPVPSAPRGSIFSWLYRAFGLVHWSLPIPQTQRWVKSYKVNLQMENKLKLLDSLRIGKIKLSAVTVVPCSPHSRGICHKSSQWMLETVDNTKLYKYCFFPMHT